MIYIIESDFYFTINIVELNILEIIYNYLHSIKIIHIKIDGKKD